MSAKVLNELVRSLNSKKEKMTIHEAEIFKQCKSDAIGGVALGGSVAVALTWMATRKLNVFNRLGLAGGAGFLIVSWSMNKALDSCVDHILGLDGTRMQQELNRIILETYGNDPKKMQLYSKYFYGEEVFNDSTPGLPKLVYRPRNLYMDEHRTSDVNTSQESIERGLYHARRNDDTNIKLKTPSSEIKKNPRNPGINVFGYGDPLDVLFGDSSANENPDQLDKSGKSTKSQSHSQRRARRRHRARLRHEESSSVGMTQLHGA